MNAPIGVLTSFMMQFRRSEKGLLTLDIPNNESLTFLSHEAALDFFTKGAQLAQLHEAMNKET